MAVKFGRARHMSKIMLKDHLKYPIWIYAHDERHDEEWWKPVVSPSSVTREVLRKDHPVLTLRVKDSDTYAIGSYDHEQEGLYNMVLWLRGRWVLVEQAKGLKFPMTFVAIPPILRESDVEFILRRQKDRLAKRVS